jgi:hypothetical protein
MKGTEMFKASPVLFAVIFPSKHLRVVIQPEVPVMTEVRHFEGNRVIKER